MLTIKAIDQTGRTQIFEAFHVNIDADRLRMYFENHENNSLTELKLGANYHKSIFIENTAGRTVESLRCPPNKKENRID